VDAIAVSRAVYMNTNH